MTRGGTSTVALMAASLLASSLMGCATYNVEIENTSRRTVTVAVEQDQLGGDPIRLYRGDLRAGRSATLGPYEVPSTDPISLRVSDAGDVYAVPERIRLEAGTMRFKIEDGSIDSWAKMEVVEVVGDAAANDEREPR